MTSVVLRRVRNRLRIIIIIIIDMRSEVLLSHSEHLWFVIVASFVCSYWPLYSSPLGLLRPPIHFDRLTVIKKTG